MLLNIVRNFISIMQCATTFEFAGQWRGNVNSTTCDGPALFLACAVSTLVCPGFERMECSYQVIARAPLIQIGFLFAQEEEYTEVTPNQKLPHSDEDYPLAPIE